MSILVTQSDRLDFLRSLEPGSVDLIFGSPPYQNKAEILLAAIVTPFVGPLRFLILWQMSARISTYSGASGC